jgi:hypothetical protein
MSAEHWIVGPEHDEALFARLGVVLSKLGYRLGSSWDGVGGSQEISHWEIAGLGGNLVVESETYIGLSVSGPAELVSVVREHFSRVLPANNSLQARRP